MDARKIVESCVVDWIWPMELACIVASYTVPPAVRWSVDQMKPTIWISTDGLTAELTNGSENGGNRSYGGHAYVEVIGDRPLNESATDWTVRLSPPVLPGYWQELVCRIGVLSADIPFSPPIVFRRNMSTCSVCINQQLAGDSSTVRFSLSADLETGNLTTRVWSTTAAFADVTDWFTVTTDPAVLATAVPIVYCWFDGTRIELV